MKLYWVRTGQLIKKLFKRFVWDLPNNDNIVYLTFDDGPIPEVTEWVLQVLREHGAKATFFCIGNNIDKNPDIFKKVIDEGHAIGNHTYNHVNGWKTDNKEYLENIEATESSIVKYLPSFSSNRLFRPPYGRLKRTQSTAVKDKGYKIIMWDVLSADFDNTITPEQCLQNVISNTHSGSVIIFHDSIKAYNNLHYALPRTLEYLKEKGFSFGKIF